MPKAHFVKSPLAEVVFGVEFNAQRFSAVHFGLYWQEIKDQFSQHPLDRPPVGVNNIFGILPPLPRVWFQSADQKELIQLQNNRFYYNWTKRDEDYPHFEEIHPKFLAQWNNFKDWWLETEQKELQSNRYHMTYVNQIDANFGWNGVEDSVKIFNFLELNWHSSDLKPNIFNANLEFLLPEEQGTLSVMINQGTKPQDNSPVLILNITSVSKDTTTKMETWFKLAHQSTVAIFLSLISQSAKNLWGFQWLQ